MKTPPEALLPLLAALAAAAPACPAATPPPDVAAPPAAADDGRLAVAVESDLFDGDGVVPGVRYTVIVSRRAKGPDLDLWISSWIDDRPVGVFENCDGNVYYTRFETENLGVNWTLEDLGNAIERPPENVTFRVDYRVGGRGGTQRGLHEFPVAQGGCELYLRPSSATVSHRDLPSAPAGCRLWFPQRRQGRGLLAQLLRFNVPCGRGHVAFLGGGVADAEETSGNGLCGKLEELPESDRRVYFPSLHPPPSMEVSGNPVFTISYRLVDHCYNVTYSGRNGTVEVKPKGPLQCTFRIYLPYGNRVALRLKIGDENAKDNLQPPITLQDFKNGSPHCRGLLTVLHDGQATWQHCTKSGDAERQVEIVSRENRVVLRVFSEGQEENQNSLTLKLDYRAEPVTETVGPCEFGWVALRQFCVTALEEKKETWRAAEVQCQKRNGHLLSIRGEEEQQVVDRLLLNSPGYRDHNAYWIGASDVTHEGDFRWSDGLPFSYANWFPGWPQHRHYNRQPNDDSLSEQDCVELRRAFALPGNNIGMAPGYSWNDRDCSATNFFLCERLQTDEPLDETWPPDCNRSVALSRSQPRAAVSSPGFPKHYPDNADCDTDITAPPGFRIVMDFEELVIENEPTCSYDYLEISEPSSGNVVPSRRLCGDWSARLKLLRHVSNGSKLKLRFSSDYSHHFGGYKARVRMESATKCSDDRFHAFNGTCYLVVNYPEVTWRTARDICGGMKSFLTSILTLEEDNFVTTAIRKSPEYRTSALYWLGASSDGRSQYSWLDGSPVDYEGWLPGEKPSENDLSEGEEKCLGVRWTPSPSHVIPSGLYWTAQRCDAVGGYVCKRKQEDQGIGINFNKTINGTEGNFSSPNFPNHYYNNLDFFVRITGPERTRLVIKFLKIDIEPQLDCLYDFVEVQTIFKGGKKSSTQFGSFKKLCGHHDKDMKRFDFVSETNEAMLRFHSDYSVTGNGFALSWHAVDVSACPMQTLTATEGILLSPNYPNFLLAHLDCTFTILAPNGKRVWIDFLEVDVGKEEVDKKRLDRDETKFEIRLNRQSNSFTPFQTEDLLTDGTFVSSEERLKVKIRTGDYPKGKGFKAFYRITSALEERKTIVLSNDTQGLIYHLNFPDPPAPQVDFLQHFVAPLGHTISLELYNVKPRDIECSEDGIIEIFDSYSDTNGTVWVLCYYGKILQEEMVLPIYIKSFLNTLYIRQKSGVIGIPLNGSLRVQTDENIKTKLLTYKGNDVESCSPNPCENGGKCVSKKGRKFCQCTVQFTGLFCALTKCDFEPCIFGTCELTPAGYSCKCKSGYTGPTCEQRKKPCAGNPCEGRGICKEKGEGFVCQCHAWWEGPRCEKRMLHIPYKPLSERMLHEPFWLGLMTVFVVMAVIGLVWCAKRHFPEKIEKLLAEEDSRNRVHSARGSSVRDQLAAAAGAAPPSAATAAVAPPSAGAAPPGGGAAGGAPPRSLLGRLGIRKPSLLSLAATPTGGPRPPEGPRGAAAPRTASLDDLLRPPPGRTPSPKKRRNNSTPTKKNVAEKKQILQQLISPNNKQMSRKVSLGELIQMSENKIPVPSKNSGETETKFGETDAQTCLTDPKLEKKVTFARLLNKVSAEMSSCSDVQMGIMQMNKLGCALARPSSTPPSPGGANTSNSAPIRGLRSPNSTSSTQGSAASGLFGSVSDIAAPSGSTMDLIVRGGRRMPNGRPKPASADSILAMFRNFSSSSAGANLPSSLKVSPSTTPTASSPQDDIAGDDESSTSSIHTPVSFSSGPPESPILHRQGSTIEVPVLDPLTAHKQSTPSGTSQSLLHPPTILLEIPSAVGKCLSPIRELPTPLPSPALTPVMRRSPAHSPQLGRTTAGSSSIEDNDISDDRISVELPNISISCSDNEDEEHCTTDIVIDPQAEDGLIIEESAAAMHSAFKRNRPPPLGQTSPEQIKIKIEPPPLVIPTLTVQTPSPTHSRSPSMVFPPGSPPPQRSQDSFNFPQASSGRNSRKMFKDFDKPTSLDLPCAPPMITITCNMSEADSDAEGVSPNAKPQSSGGMTYLSPFSIARGEHNASESNLSSSGYSSMASPGPSRCGSSNPLCPSEMEDPGPGGCHRRASVAPVLKTVPGSGTKESTQENNQRRGRSDSETLSDDPLLESNDEGIGTDHIDEKIDEGELKSAKELEVFMISDTKTVLELPNLSTLATPKVAKCISLEDTRILPPNNKNSLQLPSIVVQCESPGGEKHLSPMSSRSESPLSDRTTGVSRFSTHFYGRNKDLLPFTDSDGLYDFPSTDKVNVASPSQHKKTGRKREKKTLRNCKTPSPTKQSLTLTTHLDIPSKQDPYYPKVPPPRKLSPKRRIARSQVVSSSSSSDSIVSAREIRLSSSSPSPDTIRWSSAGWLEDKGQRSHEASEEDTGDDCPDANSSMLSKSMEFSKSTKSKHTNKISRLRAISHQIRFLRRLEMSLKRRERVPSPDDSLDSCEEQESPRATSPLLHTKGPKIEIKKSSSIGAAINRNRRFQRAEPPLLGNEEAWPAVKVVFSGNGHSD